MATVTAPKRPSREPEAPHHEMSQTEKVVDVIAVVLPLIAFIAAIVLLWNSWVSALDLGILAVGYALTGVGITIGYHRLLTHRAFMTHKATAYVFAILGSMAVQGKVIEWVADHRKHHAFTDQDGDPHTPHGHGGGLKGTLHGLFHAHVGWFWTTHGLADWKRYAPDLYEDRGMRRINRAFPQLVGLSLVLPFLAGWLLSGSLFGGLTGLLWGGFVRIFLLHHVTWSINSICHFMGTRRFATEDESRNVFWLSLISFGEAWHHNHHAFPRSAFHGLRWWELDPAGLIVRAMQRVGLAWNVVRITPERQRAKSVAAAGDTGAG